MAWYKFWESSSEEKLNPAQPYINESSQSSRERPHQFEAYYEKLEVVNRGVNMIVDDSAQIPAQVGDALASRVVKGVKKETVRRLLNEKPNPYQDINTFKRNLIIDFVMEGNIFIYFDGHSLYHLPANKVVIHGSSKTYIEKYTYMEEITYKPDEIIHVKDNSFYSIYRGVPRLKSALRSMELLSSMQNFQDNFFENGAVPGLVIKSPNTLSTKIKERLLASWAVRFNPKSGGKRPMILDGGLELDSVNDVNFKELDFQGSIDTQETKILKALGVPPILLDGGNNANIRPNLRMYYLETVLPIVRKINYAYERYFGFKITEDITGVTAMQPELKELSDFYVSLTNGGIIVAEEARAKLGFEELNVPETTEIRVPANIAGSAAEPSQGGRPSEGEE